MDTGLTPIELEKGQFEKIRQDVAYWNVGSINYLTMSDRTLRAFFNWAKRQNYILQSPVTVSPPKLPESVIPVFSEKDVQAMLQCCNTASAVRDRAVILTLYDTGMRVGELATMKLDDIDMDGRLVTVRGKGKKQRVLKVSAATYFAVYRYVIAEFAACSQILQNLS
jgi:integrase/recombinase XerC/integrase/recombinase XerD